MIQVLHLSSSEIASRLLVLINSILFFHECQVVTSYFEMYSIRPYQAYSFLCWFSNNSVLAFVVSVLCQDIVFYFVHSFPFSLFFRRHFDVALFYFFSFCSCQDQVLFILSSLASLLNRSAIRICSSLFLFSNGVFSTLFTFVVLFSRICSTSQGSLVSLVCQRSNLVLPLLFLFCFPSGAILDLGTRSSRSGGVL